MTRDTFIVIGASNVTIALPLIWQGVKRHAERPTDLLVAAGHGRSFGQPNTVLGRTLPGILSCGLWKRISERPPQTSGQSDADSGSTQPLARAVITDVGNDIMYGVSPDVITDWVRECVDRLRASGVEVCLTGMPMGSLRQLSRRRFNLFRRLLFPNSQLTWEVALSHAESVDNAIYQLALQHSLQRRVPEANWYGIDPIHIRRKHRRTAWTDFLSCLNPTLSAAPCSLTESVRVWASKAETINRRSRLCTTLQPAGQHDDKSLWLY